MAPPKKNKAPTEPSTENTSSGSIDDYTTDLIKSLNKEAGDRIAYNLASDMSPTHIERWISTGSIQLDYIISNKRGGGLPEGRIIELFGQTCHGKGDKVLRPDGSTVKVENIKVGDYLLGPDNTPRKVLEIHHGIDELYEIKPKRGGKTYTVNSNHILTLKRGVNTDSVIGPKKPKQVSLSVKEYLKQSTSFKKHYRQEKSVIDTFAGRSQTPESTIPAYILGLLIGDGSIRQARTELTSADVEILQEYKNFCSTVFGYEVALHSKKDNKATGIYHLNGKNTGKEYGPNNIDPDQLRTELKRLGLMNTSSETKFIPDTFKYSNKENRLELLAGLVDTDGYYGSGCFEYCSKSLQLAEDVQFIANSLGFFATVSTKWNKRFKTMYYRVCIAGNIDIVPTRLSRKKASVKTRSVNTYLTGFSLKSKGSGEYFGFELDGDHLYLTDDMTVFHNSIGKSHVAYQVARSTQALGGVVVYIDTENATSPENLSALGVDIKRRFAFVETACTEEVFKIMESSILKFRALNKDVPLLIVWDSVAATSPKAELEGDYDKETMGLQARVLSKGLRKITQLIGNKNVTLLLVNQIRMKIGCVNPDTLIEARLIDNQSVEHKLTIKEFFKILNHDFDKMKLNTPLFTTGWQVKTVEQDGNFSWEKVSKIVRKQPAKHFEVVTSSDRLSCSPEHKIYVQDKRDEVCFYAEVKKLKDKYTDYLVMTSKGWDSFEVIEHEDMIDIADIEVEHAHSYLGNNILNHNTMFGDPCVTPETKITIRKKCN